MTCRKCQKLLPEDALFCPYCGIKQTLDRPKKRTRGNGQGSVYKLLNGKYRAAVVLGYENGRCKRRTKSGFKTKKKLWNIFQSCLRLSQR